MLSVKRPETAPLSHDAHQCIAPLVISASRATDIPAFHGKWLLERLRAGYCTWENPFNAAQRQIVSFEQCKVIVFWTKNPAPLIPLLPEITAHGIQFYFQFTLNDYDDFGLEPGLPQAVQRTAIFRKLSEQIGSHRLIWRFDPIILGGRLTVENTLERLYVIGKEVAPWTEKLVFSFVDWYKKTERNLCRLDPRLRPPTVEEMRQIAHGIAEVERALPTRLKLATCAEPHNFEDLGIRRNRCIDPELLLRLCPECREFRDAYGKPEKKVSQATLPGITAKTHRNTAEDSGQRKDCGCVPSKDIGKYDTCLYSCTYCYANQQARIMLRNRNISHISSGCGDCRQ